MNYATLAATARKLIASAGKPVTLTAHVPGVYDPVAGVETGGSDTTFTGSGVQYEFDYTTQAQAMTLNAELRLLCVNIPKPIPDRDTLTVGGVVYQVVHSAPLEPGTVTLLYDVWVK